MTSKHYIAMASAIKTRLENICPDTVIVGHIGKTCQLEPCKSVRLQTELIARDFATIAKNDNPRFDKDRFLHACGL